MIARTSLTDNTTGSRRETLAGTIPDTGGRGRRSTPAQRKVIAANAWF